MGQVSDVDEYARETMRGFDYRFLPLDDELMRRLWREERSLLSELVRIDNMALALPGDSQAAVDVSVYAASYDLPATLWRVRQATLSYSAGDSRPVRMVSANWRNGIPREHPSMYFQGSKLYPLDGGATRRYGWSLAASLDLEFIAEPRQLTSLDATLNAPDEAIPYLAMFLAHYMAVRGKVAQQTLAEIKALLSTARSRLFEEAGGLPGADPYPSEG